MDTIQILLFAGLAESIGQSSVHFPQDQLPLATKALKEQLMKSYPKAASLISVSLTAVNQEYAGDEHLILPGDEVALIPPVSGGDGLGGDSGAQATPTVSADGLCMISGQTLQPDETLAKVQHRNHGASLSFVGTTREMTGEMKTVTLEYEAYVPMALAEMQKIVQQIQEQWPGARCAISHRIGTVDVGEISVVIAVSAPHRDSCYDASRYAIEELKRTVPIWKKEIWEDGSEWKGVQTGPWAATFDKN
ncbi:molybdenum cofactor biosynthesis protein MoaE [Paenibacillus sp. JSM ZJ436]|uniref:molybdenum cofactor biosynthesis protein MoaE n=1 Tax=Paenibacillus sp. JSM ZJ436 TaxID=3376190 RepID=UPI0037B70E85